MNRRKFFAFLPVAPLALIAEGVRAAEADKQPHGWGPNLTLVGSKKVGTYKVPITNGPNYFVYPTQTDPDKQISMAVGEDGELWIRSKDKEWKKVMTQ